MAEELTLYLEGTAPRQPVMSASQGNSSQPVAAACQGNSSQPVDAACQGGSSQPVVTVACQGNFSQPVAAERKAGDGVPPVSNDVLSNYFPDVCEWIESKANIKGQVTWRRILKAHVIRSKDLGGPICNVNLADVLTFESLPSGEVKASLLLPHSFEPDDFAACGACALAWEKKDAEEAVCRAVTTELILEDALNFPQSKMVLHQSNWKISLLDLHAEVAAKMGQNVSQWRREDTHIPQTANSRARKAWSFYRIPAADQVETRKTDVELLLVTIAENENGKDGWACPDHLKRIMFEGQKLPPWVLLARMVEPGTLVKFLEDRPHMFEVRLKDGGRKLDAFRRVRRAVVPQGLSRPQEQPVALAESRQPVQDPDVLRRQPACQPLAPKAPPPKNPDLVQPLDQPQYIEIPCGPVVMAVPSRPPNPAPLQSQNAMQPVAHSGLPPGLFPYTPSMHGGQPPGIYGVRGPLPPGFFNAHVGVDIENASAMSIAQAAVRAGCRCGHCAAAWFAGGWTCPGPR